MTHQTFARVEAAIRGAFDRSTCSEDDLPMWSVENPSRGHCAVVALTINDLFGGDLLCAKVHRSDALIGYHWWNRLAGIDIDLTRCQFLPEEVVGEPLVYRRPVGDSTFYEAQYKLFRAKVEALLSAQG
jgi:hypothetical protein